MKANYIFWFEKNVYSLHLVLDGVSNVDHLIPNWPQTTFFLENNGTQNQVAKRINHLTESSNPMKAVSITQHGARVKRAVSVNVFLVVQLQCDAFIHL